MDEDDFCEDCEADIEHGHAIPPGRWSWFGPLILGVQVAEETVQAVSDGLNGLKTMLCAHVNYAVDRDAVRDLEKSIGLMSQNSDIS